MMCNYYRFGGVVRDIPDDVMQKIKDLVFDRLPAKTEEMDRFLSENEILVSRMKGVGYLDAEDAMPTSRDRSCCCGLRACPMTCAAPSPIGSMTASTSTWRCATTATCSTAT